MIDDIAVGSVTREFRDELATSNCSRTGRVEG